MAFKVQPIEVPEDDPYRNDALERRGSVEFLADLVRKIEGPFVLGIDSPWGTGKSTLMQMFQVELKNRGCCCISVNAWSIDYVDDPLIAMVGVLDEGYSGTSEVSRTIKSQVKAAAAIVAKRGMIAGIKAATAGFVDLDQFTEKLLADAAGDGALDLIEQFHKGANEIRRLKDSLARLVTSDGGDDVSSSLVFFVDELDRCRPSFAIHLLERIKHVFDIPGVVFVLAVDREQLEASVKSVYGVGIDAKEYLRKFIDLEFSVPAPSGKAFTNQLMKRFGFDDVFLERSRFANATFDKDDFVAMFSALAEVYDLSLRAREQCFTRLAVVLEVTPADRVLNVELMALLIVLRVQNQSIYDSYIRGVATPEEVMATISQRKGGVEFANSMEGVTLEARLIRADPARGRAESRMAELTTVCAEATSPFTPEVSRASVLLDATRRCRPRAYGIDARYLAEKIDLAANFRR